MAEPEHPALEALRARLREEEAAYAEVLAAVDRLSALTLPAEAAPEVRERLATLNSLWSSPKPPTEGGITGLARQQAWAALAPALERQQAFNAALVRYAQRVAPVVDARDRVATALATTRSELLLEAFDRRLESLARRLDGLRERS